MSDVITTLLVSAVVLHDLVRDDQELARLDGRAGNHGRTTAKVASRPKPPELRRRGLFRTEYTGTTLRDHLGLAPPVSPYQADQVAASA